VIGEHWSEEGLVLLSCLIEETVRQQRDEEDLLATILWMTEEVLRETHTSLVDLMVQRLQEERGRH
jgi:hypothetical protein